MVIISRIDEIDIIKGGCIILMVLGHTWFPGRSFIYLFHMSVFFIASGYCWKEDNCKDIDSFKRFVKKKGTSLYIPYVITNLVFLLLNNMFLYLNIYTNNKMFLIDTANWQYQQILMEKMSLSTIGKSAIKILLFVERTQLGSATWFLCTLFLVLLVHWGICYYFHEKNRYLIILVGILIVCLIVSFFMQNGYSFIPGVIKRFFSAYAAFLIGNIIRKIDAARLLYSPQFAGLSIFVLILADKFGRIELANYWIQNPFFYFIVSMAGWILCFYISNLIVRRLPFLERVLKYIGKHTMIIVLLHLICFKLVTFIYIVATKKPLYMLAAFHVLFDVPWYMYIIYTFIGVGAPLVLESLSLFFVDFLSKKLRSLKV